MGAAEAESATGERQSFLSHLEELRTRLVRASLALLVGFGVCYWQIEPIFRWLVRPLRAVQPDSPLVMLKLTEAFMTYLKLALWAGLLFASPVVLYQIWAFVAPGLYRNEKRLIAPLVIASTLLFVLGAAFTYYIVLPFAFTYLILEFATGDVKATLSMSSYVSSTCLFMTTFGLIFQIPVLMLLLARMGLVKAATLARNRKYVLLACFVLGAVLSPPDVFSQTMVSLPMFLLFEVSVWIIRVQDLLRRGRQAAPTPAG
ncbi:MAG TPA: twin-arginine translocase subunit TatC [Candidatus Methanoperedens sp.]|nr:twin-arginine translocase subunit TatC [Candidatus Methanoperedens sp.]